MKELIEAIAKVLVDHPDDVSVRVLDHGQATIVELRVNRDDMGRIIGRHGHTAKSIRTILNAAGRKQRKRFSLEILE